MKIPHAVALHGLQVLGVLALILERTRLSETRRLQIVAVAIVGYTDALGVATIQTFGGRAPLDVGPLALVAALAALVLLALAYAWALRAAGTGVLRWTAHPN
jgi:hypothetical protein